MAIITCPKCQATSECGEVEHGEYRLSYDSFKMVQLCQEIHRRQLARETIGCSEFVNHDEELLRRLTLSAVWRGRYPVPLYYRGGEEKFKDGKRYSLEVLGASDIPRIKDFVHRLRQHVNALDTYRAPRDQIGGEEKSDESE